MKDDTGRILDVLMENYPMLEGERTSIVSVFDTVLDCYGKGGKLLVCGNGGSAADAEHIVGELMKSFMLKRPIPRRDAERIVDAWGGSQGRQICDSLQCSLPAISLVSQSSLITAVANDVSADMVFAQQVYGYGEEGDLLIGISTSGNARNVCNAVRVAKGIGMKTVGLTGQDGGELKSICDLAISVPATSTHRIQEYHQPIYHALCAMVEEERFG